MSVSSLAEASVAILMGVHNGGRFLEQQLRSISEQSHHGWSLHISDDGSVDDTRAICEAFQAAHAGRVTLRAGPCGGHRRNFMALATDGSIRADYFAYCDQDDIWDCDKLRVALQWLAGFPDDPALYCGRTALMDEKGVVFGRSPLFSRPPDFRNALVQSIAGGNTMVFNLATKQLLESAGNIDVVSHDWWTYQLVSGAGGKMCYDREPRVKYRQHDRNAVGSNRGWAARITRVSMLMANRFREWNDVNIAALQASRHLLFAEARGVLDEFVKARSGSLLSRFFHLIRSGVYRQTVFGNISLVGALVLRKL